MTPIGLYHPGASPLHRCPAGPKLAVLAVSLAATLWWPLQVLGALPVLYLLAGIPWRLALAQLRPLWLLLVVTAAFQAVTAGPMRALTVTGGLLAAVALAALVTLTTRVGAMLDVLTAAARPLRLVRVDPERVALLLALAVRCVPLLAGVVATVREARQARGVTGHPVALAIPVVVRALRAADALGEALTARGFDD